MIVDVLDGVLVPVSPLHFIDYNLEAIVLTLIKIPKANPCLIIN